MTSARCSLFAPTDEELGGSGADARPGDAVYHDVTSAQLWSTFDTTSTFKVAHDFAGGTFDGRYVYLVPSTAGVVARYDTGANFAAGSAWSVFDTTALDANAIGFAGAVFDGRYVYLVPSGFTTGFITVRYDTQGSFGASSSWKAFDTRTVNRGAYQFFGGAFDGRFVYFAPNGYSRSDGIVTRFDTHADFAASRSWSTFDVMPISPNHGAGGFLGAVFDGHYVYFVQNQVAGLPIEGFVARCDTQADFTTVAAWALFNLKTLDSGAVGFFGAAFDGRYLYVVPNHAGAPSLLGRYDTQGSFTASWSTFETTALGAGVSGFAGAAFDGRYIYLVPHDNGAPDGILARLDTTAPDFKASAAWSTFDTSTVNSAAKGFTGAVFDGRFLYLVPTTGGVVARFDAKAPSSLPALPSFFGSFF
jgi:hypothetical protein